MQQRLTLKAEARSVLGKKVKKLRKDGFLPANIYGKGLSSTAVQVDMKAFKDVYDQAGETGLVDIQLDGTTHPVLIKNYQLAYPLRLPLHVDFFQVNLKEKVKTMVPLAIVGEPKAVTEKIGALITPMSEVEVEALPAELPEHIEVSVEHLAALDESISIADLKVPSGVTILTDPGQVVAKIAELVVEEPEEPETPAEGEATEAEGAEAEGESKEDGTKEEEKDAD